MGLPLRNLEGTQIDEERHETALVHNGVATKVTVENRCSYSNGFLFVLDNDNDRSTNEPLLALSTINLLSIILQSGLYNVHSIIRQSFERFSSFNDAERSLSGLGLKISSNTCGASKSVQARSINFLVKTLYYLLSGTDQLGLSLFCMHIAVK